MNRPIHTHFGTGKKTLHLTDEENSAYNEEARLLNLKYLNIEREKRGFWSDQKNCYVKTKEELSEGDDV